MPDDITEADEVRIVCDVDTDAETLSNCLYGDGYFFFRPDWLGRYGRLADGTRVHLAGGIARNSDDETHRLRLRSYTYLPGEFSIDSPENRRPGYAIEIEIQDTEAGRCKLSAKAETWCGTTLIYILDRASAKYGGVWPAILQELPEFATVADWDFPNRNYSEATFYVNTDADSITRWLIRRGDFIDGFKQYNEDGSGFQLVRARETKIDYYDRAVQVEGWLLCKRDARGIRAGQLQGWLITFWIESLSAHRCKIDARVTEERFSECYYSLLYWLAGDYPEARDALVSARVLDDVTLPKPLRLQARNTGRPRDPLLDRAHERIADGEPPEAVYASLVIAKVYARDDKHSRDSFKKSMALREGESAKKPAN